MTLAEQHRDLALALEAFYEQGRHHFWEVFAETPQQAVIAVRDRPETFGQLDPLVVGINRRRLHARIVNLAQHAADRRT